MKIWHKTIKLAKICILSKKLKFFEIYCQFSSFDPNFFCEKIIFYFFNCTDLALILTFSLFISSELGYLIDKSTIFEYFGQKWQKMKNMPYSVISF